MKYWEEFQSKWGFGDGDTVPPDAKACRHVYVREINRLATANGSSVRLLAYDRQGMHNCYLIVRVKAEEVKDVEPELLCRGQWDGGWELDVTDWTEPGAGEAMEEAIREAFELDLDGCVVTEVSVRPANAA